MAKTLSVLTRADRGSSGARRAAMSSTMTSTPSGGAASDFVEQGGGRAAVGLSRMLGRKVAHARIAQLRRGRASALKLALCAYLVGDRGGDEVLLGGEVSIEGAVGQPRI